MTQQEEITLKLGVDHSQVEPGLNHFTDKSKSAFEKFKHHQESARAGARALHKTIEAMSESIPGLGLVVSGFFNIVTGALGGATAAFVYMHKQLERGNELLNLFGSTAKMRLGDSKKAAEDAKEATEQMVQKFRDQDEKDAREQQDKIYQAKLDRELKNIESNEKRKLEVQRELHKRTLDELDRQDRQHQQAKKQADEAARGEGGRGSIDDRRQRNQAAADLQTEEAFRVAREMAEIQNGEAERQIRLQAAQRSLAARQKAKRETDSLLKASNKVLPEVEAEAAGTTKAGAKRQYDIRNTASEAEAIRAHLEKMDAQIEEAQKYRDETKRVPLKNVEGLMGLDKVKAEAYNLEARRENIAAALKEKATGMSGDEMVDALQSERGQLSRALQKAEEKHKAAVREQKRAEAAAEQARGERNKLLSDSQSYQTGIDADQRSIDEIGRTKKYLTLEALAMSGNKTAQRAVDLQKRMAGEDPLGIEWGRDSLSLSRLQGQLQKQGLQPSATETALEKVISGDTLRVRVLNAD